MLSVPAKAVWTARQLIWLDGVTGSIVNIQQGILDNGISREIQGG